MTNSNIAIKVESLSKCYQIYNNPNDRLKQIFFKGRKQFYREFWAVKDVSFEIKKGETVGIVGRNGSGKSTLLQIICGTLNPTSGNIEVNGRVSALLELGSGFSPEFSGRENVYLNASLLGLSKSEIDERYDDILAFSEIGEFIEQPVKTYSSGMLMRLAFSVAINVDPDILVVDEALSVGDELFQRKCFARIEQIKKAGTTILFVSHSASVISEICDRAILMNKGSKVAEGLTRPVLAQYQKILYSKDYLINVREESPINMSSDPPIDQYSDFYVADFTSLSMVDLDSYGAVVDKDSLNIRTLGGKKVNHLKHGENYIYSYKVHFKETLFNVRFGMVLKTTTGFMLGGTFSSSLKDSIVCIQKGSVLTVNFTFENILNAGIYYINAGVFSSIDGSEALIHRIVDGMVFKVINEPEAISTEIIDFKISPKVTYDV